MFKKIDKAVDWLGSKQWLVVIFLSSTLGGIGVNWGLASYAWFVDGGPRLWLLVFVTAFLVISLVFTILGKFTASRNLDRVRADVEKRRLLEADSFNPLEDVFEKKILSFESIYVSHKPILENKTFRKCVFIGPGSMSFAGYSVNHEGSFSRTTLVCFQPPKMITASVQFKDCKFFDCEFHDWILLVDNGQQGEVFKKIMIEGGNHEYIIEESKSDSVDVDAEGRPMRYEIIP